METMGQLSPVAALPEPYRADVIPTERLALWPPPGYVHIESPELTQRNQNTFRFFRYKCH